MRRARPAPVRLLPAVIALVGLTGCQLQGLQAAPQSLRRPAAVAAVRSIEDAALVRRVALQAHAALREVDATYAAMKLNTPSGRRFTPQQEVAVRESLGPALEKLAAAAQAIGDALQKNATGKQTLAFASRYAALAPLPSATPAPATDAPSAPSATALIFRVSQYRVKLGAVLDFALEGGHLTELPAAERPAPKPPTP